jgi:hypothetical protein
MLIRVSAVTAVVITAPTAVVISSAVKTHTMAAICCATATDGIPLLPLVELEQ